jgi:hypothetical protein
MFLQKFLTFFLNSKSAITFFIFFISTASICAQEDISSEQVVQGLALRIAILIIAAIIALMARALLIRRLNKLMLSESKKHVVTTDDNIEIPEVPATQALHIEEIYLDTEPTNQEPQVIALEKQAKKTINRVFIINLSIGVLYAISYFFVFNGEFKIFETSYNYNNNISDFTIDQVYSIIQSITLYRLFVILFLVWTVMQFLGSRHRFASYGNGSLGFLKSFLTRVFYPFQGFWPQVLALVVLLQTLFFGLVYTEMFLLVAIVIHLILWYWLKKSGRKQINTKLLILRVFLIGKTSSFTFKSLARSWRHFGTYFTVADPSFFKVSWKRRFNYMFPFYILVVFFLYTIVTDSNKDDEMGLFAGFVFLLVVGNIFMVVFNLVRMKQKFMSSPEALTKRLNKLDQKPTQLDNTFIEEPVMCYDNTWKQAVDGLVNTADVILMDLRGFSEANKGCAYEVNILFDRVNVNSIVFMGYKDAIPLIRRIIEEQWEQLAETSPNLNTKKPIANLYVIKKENHKDVDAILKLLLGATKPI